MGNWSTSLSRNGSAKGKLLPAEFFAPCTLEVARALLGKLLVVRSGAAEVMARIVETEAYRGDDPASHSSRGRTPRTSIMFGPPGRAYVYFIYGMYEMLNFVTEPEGLPGAVLIRAAEPLAGEELMRRRRPTARSSRDLTSGPGKLCQALGIRLSHNGQPLQGPRLEVRDDGYQPGPVSCSPRVGINAGQERFWRFFLTGHPFVSRARENALARSWRAGPRREVLSP
ncbi:MAG: DNA-3-methyladenine glycosylase [Oligoflexia bacterium]|nr:DNA-3-methyladenine glycosylase [Oligoflexia bacterium]